MKQPFEITLKHQRMIDGVFASYVEQVYNKN